MPAKKGDPHNLTQTPGVHERSPAWSPDGKSIAYFSDALGRIRAGRPAPGRQGRGPVPIRSRGPASTSDPAWSPDSKKIAFIDNARTLSWIDLASGAVKQVAAEPIYGPSRASRSDIAWSPDSKWLAYSLTNRTGFQAVWLYDAAVGQVARRDRRPGRGRRAGLRPRRQVPVFPRLDRRRARRTTGSTSRSATCCRRRRSTWSRSRRRRPTRC